LRDRVPRAVRLHLAHLVDDEQPGALARSLAAPVPVAQLRRRVDESAALALDAEPARVLRPRDTRRRRLELPRPLRARSSPMAWTAGDVHGRPGGADAAAA